MVCPESTFSRAKPVTHYPSDSELLSLTDDQHKPEEMAPEATGSDPSGPSGYVRPLVLRIPLVLGIAGWFWVALMVAFPPRVSAQESCPAEANPAAAQGWTAYRANDMEAARSRFDEALAACPDHEGALTGMGYVELRSGNDSISAELFEGALAQNPGNTDVLTGLGLLAWRAGDLEEVAERFMRVRELLPGDATAEDYLSRLPEGLGPPPERPPLVLPDTLQYPARALEDRFEIRTPDGWRPFWVKGVNLGAALPGRFASEFPDSTIYAGWIRGMADMGANAVRVYTIHPPDFYEALAEHNRRHPDDPLWIIHGVWTELPPDDDYLDPRWEGEFFSEMRRVVDLLHGRADIKPRPGHASGFYTIDVSDWVLAYIIGREWEPFSVTAFDSIRPGFREWRGEYLTVAGGNAMDAWLGRAVEEIVAYETETYREQRPAAYTNWPTLDPLHHPTETTRQEEVDIREGRGEVIDVRPREFNNDAIGLDPSLARATDAFPAGYFASYHAYPYYPDLMVLDPEYRRARSPYGPSAYFGYLSELKEHHDDLPVLVAEYGVPASLGLAHLQPDGWHHGGHTEASMAETDARLTRELAAAGMAGGALFAWIDEWFKRNWIVLEFELPGDRNRLWLNRLDAEQHYGVWAMEAEAAVAGETLEERLLAWRDVEPLHDGDGPRLRVTHDEAYVWLLVEGEERLQDDLLVSFDMVDPDAGDFRWPGGEGERLPVGLEFALRVSREEARLLVDPPQNPFRFADVGEGVPDLEGRTFDVTAPPPGLFRARREQRFNLPYRTVANEDGRYDSLRVITNRRRFARDSTEFLAVGYDRGVLPEGPPPDGFWQRSRDGLALEVRIPWTLLNVTDPGSRTVLQGPGENSVDSIQTGPGQFRVVFPDSIVGELGTMEVDGIRVVAALRSPEGGWRSLGSGAAEYRWQGWEEPAWRARLRPVYQAMREAWGELDARGRVAAAQPEPAPPDPLAAARDSANEAWLDGDTKRAEALYGRILAADSTDGAALHRMGLMRAWSERYDEGIALLDRLLELQPTNLSVRVDRARIHAWQDQLDAAIVELDEVLEDDPTFHPALEARAQFLAWAGRYEASLGAYDQLIAIGEGEGSVQRSRAQVLAWASRFEAAEAAYDGILAQNPDDLDARLGKARILAFSDRLDASAAEYRDILSEHPDNAEALRGLARALSWAGELVEGEETWRRAVERDAGDVTSLVGLGQNLRWQGRNAAALETLERAEARDPGNADLREQLRWVRLGLSPRARFSFVVEDDSDDNLMITTSLTAMFNPSPRGRLRVDGYFRDAEQNALDLVARGVTVSGSYQLEPGWTVAAGFGGSSSDAGDRDSFSSWQLSLASPGRHRVSGTAYVRKSALDATAALVNTGVDMTEFGLDGRWTPAPGWRVNASVGGASLEGTEDNSRVHGSGSVTRTLYRRWRVGLAGRAFSYDKDLRDGYFDPDFYGIAEVVGRWLWEPRDWALLLEAAPGFQQVTSDGDVTGAFRASARLTYRIDPGREVAVSGGLSSVRQAWRAAP